MYSIVDDSEVTEDESMETTTAANETPEVRAVIVNATFHKQGIDICSVFFYLPKQYAFFQIDLCFYLL